MKVSESVAPKSSPRVVRVGMAQLLVEGGEPERNFARATELVVQAAASGCDLVLLPETIDFAWTHPSALTRAQEIPGPHSDIFSGLAADHGIFIGVGLSERRGLKNYNTALLINPSGEIQLKYSKINLLEVEFPFYAVGDTLGVAHTTLGCIGVNICADNYLESVHIGKTLACMGAEIILAPSSWTVPHHVDETQDPYRDKWLRPLKQIAYYYDTVMVSATGVGYIVGGPYEGRKMVGRSLAVGPGGILAEGQFNEFAGELVTFDIPLPERTLKGTQLGDNARQKGYVF